MSRQKEITEFLENAGYRCRLLPAEYADAAVREVRALFDSGEVERGFARHFDSRFDPNWREEDPHAASVLIIASPSPMIVLRFPWRGERRQVTLSPGYSWAALDREIGERVAEAANRTGARFRPVRRIPLKLLAVKSGLCDYGRNNIAYCGEFGSFLRLSCFAADVRAEEAAPLREAAFMPACENCGRCRKACPNGCMESGRTLIRAERCLPYFNENGGEFPEWISPGAHNALVGCMLCQLACPQNRGRARTVVREDAFSEEDAARILAGGAWSDLPAGLRETLAGLNLDEFWASGALSRNLRVLLQKQKAL